MGAQRQKLIGLMPREYEHPSDRRALDALEGTPGMEKLVRAFYKHGVERLLKIQLTGSHLKLNPDNFPDVFDTLEEVCGLLNLPQLPQLYMMPAYGANALTTGIEQPIVVLNTDCVDLLEREELMFVIGHEVGHIKSQHVLYQEIGAVGPEILHAAIPGFGALLATGLQVALLNWQRMAEFTADRAGLLACQDADTAIGAMAKLAGLPRKHFDSFNVEDFIAQAHEFEDYDADRLDKVAKVVSIMGQGHPWTVMRAAEFLKWVDSGEYDALLESCAKRKEGEVAAEAAAFCTKCGKELAADAKFCSACGTKLGGKA